MLLEAGLQRLVRGRVGHLGQGLGEPLLRVVKVLDLDDEQVAERIESHAGEQAHEMLLWGGRGVGRRPPRGPPGCGGNRRGIGRSIDRSETAITCSPEPRANPRLRQDDLQTPRPRSFCPEVPVQGHLERIGPAFARHRRESPRRVTPASVPRSRRTPCRVAGPGNEPPFPAAWKPSVATFLNSENEIRRGYYLFCGSHALDDDLVNSRLLSCGAPDLHALLDSSRVPSSISHVVRPAREPSRRPGKVG